MEALRAQPQPLSGPLPPRRQMVIRPTAHVGWDVCPRLPTTNTALIWLPTWDAAIGRRNQLF
ncbi:MAG: hypothetical protein AB7O78_17720 [Thermoleophilia bacterium]